MTRAHPVLMSLSEEQRRFVHTVRDLAQREFKPRAIKYLDGTFPRDNLRALAELGVLGIAVPEQYGGVRPPGVGTPPPLGEVAKGCYSPPPAGRGGGGGA